MPRQLKTYQTSAGFFDLAVAAPSMKAALEAWGSRANLFHQGFARETQDATIIAATMAKPGVVLRRPVGSKTAFREDAELPDSLPAARTAAPAKPVKKVEVKAAPRAEPAAERKAAAAYERERQRRERARREQEQEEARAAARRERAVEKAEASLEKARADHEDAKAAIERRAEAEDTRWSRQRAELEAALRRARRT